MINFDDISLPSQITKHVALQLFVLSISHDFGMFSPHFFSIMFTVFCSILMSGKYHDHLN